MTYYTIDTILRCTMQKVSMKHMRKVELSRITPTNLNGLTGPIIAWLFGSPFERVTQHLGLQICGNFGCGFLGSQTTMAKFPTHAHHFKRVAHHIEIVRIREVQDEQ
jgi:hypothetical protein